jgi:hypothetical protein
VRAPDAPARYVVEVDVLRYAPLGAAEVDELVAAVGVRAYRVPSTDRSGQPRYLLVGTLPGLRAALLAWSVTDEDGDHHWALETLAEAVPVPSPGDPRPARIAETAATLRSRLTAMKLVSTVGDDVPLWVLYAGHVHEVRRVTEASVGVRESPPGAAVPYRAGERVVVLELDAPHALVDEALAGGDVTP